MSVKLLLNILGMLVWIMLGFYGAYLFSEGRSPALFILASFIWFYYIGYTTAEFKDRRRGYSSIELSERIKKVLFLKQPNPFAIKTIIFQSVLIAFTLIALTISIFSSNVIVGVITTLSYIFGMIILALILDIRTRIGTDELYNKRKEEKERKKKRDNER